MTAQVFRLPDLGEGLTEAELVRWLVGLGDVVAVDQPIAEVETAKSVVELPSPYAGVIVVLHGEEGQTIDVGAPLIEVDPLESAAYRQEERAGSGNVLIGYGTGGERAGGRTRSPLRPSRTAPAATARPSGPVAVQSPIVRRLAKTVGVDLRAVAPSGRDGIVTRGDVVDAAAGPAPAAESSLIAGDGPVAGLGITRRESLTMLRRAAGARMTRSRAEIPEATVWVDVDASELWTIRAAMAIDGRSPSFTAFFARYLLLALGSYPALCGRLSEDGTELVEFDGVNLGIATDTQRGLLVPVVGHAELLSLGGLDDAVREVTAAARAGSLSPDRLSNSTFTLNNYGGLGVDGSAAIINHPEVAILGIGRMIERPWVFDGAIVPRRIVQLSLVFDHRVCDGGYAAGFLRTVVDAVENPYLSYSLI